MESLFRRKKLPSFSDYDGVFSKTGSPAKSRTEDYREIFGGSKCSIPVLDLSALDEVADDVARGRGKDVEYSKIFGGGGGDVAGSYEEVFAQQRTPAKKVSRADKSTPRYKKEEEYHRETPNQAPEGIKQYSTFYNRTSQGSKDGENGTTTHVAHIRAVPGFTCFVDENTQKTKIDNLGPLPKDKIQPTTRVSVDFEKKQATDSAGKLKREPSWDKLYSPDRNVTSSFKMSSPTRVPASTASETKKSRELNFNIPKMGAEKSASDNISPSFSDEELDVNSTAAVSAAALRKAVMEAEGMIRLAKEIMERKKNGIQKIPRVKKKILERASIQPTKNENVLSKLKVFNEVKIACEGVRETNDAKSNSYDDVQEHDAKLERKKARKSGKSSPSLVQSSEYCVVQNVCIKVNEKTAEASADLKETLEKDDLKTTTVELEQPRGSTMRLFMKNLFGKGNDNKFPEVTKENQKKEDLEMGDTNGCNFVLSACNISENVDQDILEPCADSKPLVMVPESVSIENEKTENLKVEHENDNNVLASVHDLCGKVKEDEVGLSAADSKAPGCTNESYVMPSGHNFSEKENDRILKTFVDPEELPEMVKTENRRTGEIKSCVDDSFSDKTNVELLETSSKLVKTDDLSTEFFGLEHENGSNIIPTVDNGPKIVNEIKPSIEIKSCVDSFSDKTNVEMLETSSRLVKTDDLRTEIFGLEHKNGSNITPTVENGPKIVNRNNLSIESVNMDSQENVTLESRDRYEGEIVPPAEHANDITPTVENGPKIVNRNNLSIESVNIDSQENATLESRDRYGGEIVPPAEHANECTEMEKQTDDGTLELLERQGKEVHRKRKQWKDFEGKPDEIKIAEDEGHSSQISIVQEPLDRNKEYRKRRQWKDVEVKSYGIKIAVDGETSIHEPKTSSSEEEAVKSHERESVSGESLNVNINHGEELDEAQKRVENDNRKECSLEPGIATLSTGVHENRGSVAHVCKEDEIEKKVLESAEWRAYEMASEVESNESGQNDDKDGSEDLGDGEVAHIYEGDDSHMSFEESERMSDASQSSIDFKEGFIFEEELGETSEVFQSCEFDGFETGSSYVEMAKDQNTIYINSIPETVVSSDNDSGDKQTELDETGYKLASKTVEIESRIEASELPNLFIGEQKMRGVYEQEWVTMINSKREEEKMKGTDEETAKESRDREVRAEKEELERNDEITKRERERENNRMVVERAIREARERAFAEARERAERAAVEKATAEARERVMAEARQKFEKTNSANKSSTEKVNLQTKLRSERAAVERAHAEARERALEKALSQKSIFPSSKLDGNNGESVERRNARLEKTQRTMERAAKALAEKNMRDLRAQREQAERHRLAETLDAEIKRWSSGKTGNLRALLSTLQYILGSDSGWVPVSLTEIVSTSAVKKAYRKATLHVHPDKLQQRGATTQQKYICEKVFDLLKAAWNRFNSEER